MSRATSRTQSPGVPRRNGARSRSFQPSQKNLWKSVKTRRERSPNFRQKQKTTIIGRFRIEDTVVGRGAWSVVKPALDLISGNEYVSKIVKKEDLHYRFGTDEVMQEVAVLQHLPVHRHIVKFIDLLDEGEEYLVILESLSNGDLCDAILECEENRIPEERAKSYFIMMTEALICCHANGISHRDVKPENMLLSEKFELKLTDFGLARMHKSSFRCTDDEKTNELVGTLRYAAPELFRGHFDGVLYDDYVSDIWSLGVCLYVMLAGVFPFSTGKYMDEEAIRDILYSDDEIEMPTTCSPEAVQLLQKLLQKEPEDRIDIRDILNEPWCQNATKPNETAPSPKKEQPEWENMEKEELINNLRRQTTTIEEQDRTISRLRMVVADLEDSLESVQRENSTLARKLSETEKTNDFSGLRNKVKQSAQILNDISTKERETPKRSNTPSSAQRNALPTRGKTSSSPIVSRKPPSRCASPGILSSVRSHDSSNYATPAASTAKPRTLSPRPVTKGVPKGLNGTARLVRPDSPGNKNSMSGRTKGAPNASRSPAATQRTTTPPKRSGVGKRLTTASPSRTPPAPARSAVHSHLVVSPSPGVKERGPIPATTTVTQNTKPFERGDIVMVTNKAEGFQCEGVVKYYGKGDTGKVVGIEVTEILKGTPPTLLHDGAGYFESPSEKGLLVLPKDCRLLAKGRP